MKLTHVASALRSPRMPPWRRWLVVLAAVYTVLPTDLVPDVLPVVGWLDDVGLLSVAVALLLREPARRADANSHTA